MADITISLTIADIFKEIARRTSVATETDGYYAQKTTEQRQYSQLHGEGDRITTDLVNEASKEVLRCFISRQGDVVATPFNNDGTNISYSFSEGTPPVGHSDVIQDRLKRNCKDAIIYYVLAALYKMDGNTDKAVIMQSKFDQLINELTGDLYRLHD